MLSNKEKKETFKIMLKYLDKVGIVINLKNDLNKLEVSDYELGNFKKYGVSMVVYINTKRVCAKEIILLPNQTVIQHKHGKVVENMGKEETFRCRFGEFYLYVPGRETIRPNAKIDPEDKKNFTVWKEIILKPGDQYTVYPETWHWFQAGNEGAVITEFSTPSTNLYDIYYDRRAKRISKY